MPRPLTLIDVLKEINRVARQAASPGATLGEIIDNLAPADGVLTLSVTSTSTAAATAAAQWGNAVWGDSHYTWG